MFFISFIDWKLKDLGYLRRQAHEMSDGTCSDSDLDIGVKKGYPADRQDDYSNPDVDYGSRDGD